MSIENLTFEDQLKNHLETWGPNCGAPLAVYQGHLMALLKSHSEELREEIRSHRLAVRNAAGDNLCWIDGPVPSKIPPREEFLESCRRYHAQISGERGELTGCRTIAQLEARIIELEDEIAKRA